MLLSVKGNKTCKNARLNKKIINLKMNCYDKLKLSIPMQCVTYIDYNKFPEKKEKNNITTYKYEIFKPYHLSITIRPFELLLEFSGKILLDNYIYLINKNTIYECLKNINKSNIVQLDIDKTINNSEVLICAVTKDFQGILKEIKQYIVLNIIDRINWKVTTPKRNNNIILENNVMINRYKKRLTFYEKSKEIRKAPNKEFLQLLNDKEKVLDYFNENNIRVECNINVEKQIRDMLNIKENQLLNVLNSEANPILTILDEAVRNVNDIEFNTTNEITTLKELEKLAVIEKCDYDMLAVEQLIKTVIPKNTALSRKLDKYYDVFDKIKKNNMPRIDLHKLVS